MTDGVVLAHDYATQRGGAERVALKIAEAFPGSPMYTTLYEPKDTFPEFADLDLRPGRLNRFGVLRRRHRLALPLLARAVTAQEVSGDLLVASSSGWAHGYQGARHTIVYCHSPARWLYSTDRYLGTHTHPGARGRLRRAAARTTLNQLMSPLRDWDLRSARRADVYLANSTVTQRAIAEVYGVEAEVLPPPPALVPGGEERSVPGVEPGFLLCVARLMPYKNVDIIIEAVNALSGLQLVVVGKGPDRERLQTLAGPRVRFLGGVSDAELRWLYVNCSALVAASHEDYGLSPLEAGTFGRPSVVLRYGGFLDTVAEGQTGVFFDTPTAGAFSEAVREALRHPWSSQVITDTVDRFASHRFAQRLQEVAAQLAGAPVGTPAPRQPEPRQRAGPARSRWHRCGLVGRLGGPRQHGAHLCCTVGPRRQIGRNNVRRGRRRQGAVHGLCEGDPYCQRDGRGPAITEARDGGADDGSSGGPVLVDLDRVETVGEGVDKVGDHQHVSVSQVGRDVGEVLGAGQRDVGISQALEV